MLAQDNPELCERIAKSLGTYQREERTVQVTRGPLLTEDLGGASARLVEAYRLHPNAIKSLEPVGQGYLLGRPRVGRKGRTASQRKATAEEREADRGRREFEALARELQRARPAGRRSEPGERASPANEQTRPNGAFPVCYPRLPETLQGDYELPRNEQSKVDGAPVRAVRRRGVEGRRHEQGPVGASSIRAAEASVN